MTYKPNIPVHSTINIAFLLLLSLVLFVPLLPAYAEGPGTGGRRIQLDGTEAGPYLVRVVSSPTPPRIENFYLEVRVTAADSQELITDAIVMIEATKTESSQGETYRVEAVHDIAPIPTEYAAHLPLAQSGVWEIRIMIEGRQGYGETSYYQRISPQNSIGPIISVGAPAIGLVGLVVVFLWLQRRNYPGESVGESDESD